MAVYVDDMGLRGPMGRFGRMRMSHLVADSEGELVSMGRRLGLKDSYLQNRGSSPGYVHYDVCLSKRREAISLGAIPVTMKALVIWRRVRASDG